jgi:predicted MFS family arabinose efflux permease
MVLGATPAQMGILSAIGSASTLLFSLSAGVLADRVKRRPIMIAADLGRALLLGAIPVFAGLHLLSIAQLIAIAAVAGILTVLFDVAYQSYLPSLVGSVDLLEGNRLLSISGATAEILGPSLTGILVQLISAPRAILLDALSFLVSGASVFAIRVPEPAPQPSGEAAILAETLAGFRTILAHPTLRLLLLRAVFAFFSMGPVFTFYVLYPIRILHLRPAALGLAIALGGAGSLSGGLSAQRLSKRIPARLTFFLSAVITGVATLFIPLAAVWSRYALLCLCIQQFFGDFAWTIYAVNETTLRQTASPPAVLGRVNAAMQLASRGMLPIGALFGGYIAGSFGIVNTLWLGSAGVLLSTLWLLPLAKLEIRHP